MCKSGVCVRERERKSGGRESLCEKEQCVCVWGEGGGAVTLARLYCVHASNMTSKKFSVMYVCRHVEVYRVRGFL